MSRIRYAEVDNNVDNRAGCEVQSPWTAAIYYISIEHHRVIARDWGQAERGRDPDPVTLTPTGVSACFSRPGMVVVTVAGFPPGGSKSALETFEFALAE